MNPSHPFDLVIGLDRSDRKADLYLINTHSGKAEKQLINTSPEALHDWLAQLRRRYAEGKVAICLEQPAANLILFLENYSWITLYAINPITLQKFREAFVTSPGQGRRQRRAVSGGNSFHPPRETQAVAAGRFADAPVATTGQSSPRRN